MSLPVQLGPDDALHGLDIELTTYGIVERSCCRFTVVQQVVIVHVVNRAVLLASEPFVDLGQFAFEQTGELLVTQ